MKKTSKTRDAGGEDLWSNILTSFRDTTTRSNGFKVIRTRPRPISAHVASMGNLLCLFTGAPPSGPGLTGNDKEIVSMWDPSILMGCRCMRILLWWYEDFVVMADAWGFCCDCWDNLCSSVCRGCKSSLWSVTSDLVTNGIWHEHCEAWFSKTHESNVLLDNEHVGFTALLSSGHGPLFGYTCCQVGVDCLHEKAGLHLCASDTLPKSLRKYFNKKNLLTNGLTLPV